MAKGNCRTTIHDSFRSAVNYARSTTESVVWPKIGNGRQFLCKLGELGWETRSYEYDQIGASVDTAINVCILYYYTFATGNRRCTPFLPFQLPRIKRSSAQPSRSLSLHAAQRSRGR
jgi:hypothetical protein